MQAAPMRLMLYAVLLVAGFAIGSWHQSSQSAHGGARLALLAAQDESAWWAHFVASLHRSGQLVEELSSGLDEVDRLEGYRLVTRMVALGFDRMLESGNPAAAGFYRLQSPTRKFAGDAPDQLYHSANISADYSYRIRGQMRSDVLQTLLIEASVYGGSLSFESEQSRYLVSHIDERTLQVDEEGNFEIVLSAREHSGNWLYLAPDTTALVVRRYFAEPQQHDRLPLTLERIDGPIDAAPLQRDELLKGVLGAAAFAEETTRYWHRWVQDVRDKHGVNAMGGLDDEGDLLTPAGIRYMQGAWALPAGKALAVRFTPPAGPYWSFVPMNMWMESFDWHKLPNVVSNNHRAQVNEDGSVTLMLSAEDPGHANWVSTQGHRQGLMSLRFARIGEQPLPEVHTELVDVPRHAR